MLQAQAPGVQHRARRLPGVASAVTGIAGDRVGEGREVDADLVRAPGVEITAHECISTFSLDDLVARAGEATTLDHRHPLALLRVPADRSFELARTGLDDTADDRQVGAAEGAIAELGGECAMRPVIAGGDDQAGGALVEAMDDARPLLSPGGRPAAAQAEQRVD